MNRFLLLVEILAVASLNGVVLYFSSFLAAGGDGRADGVYAVRWVGGSAIAIFTVWALIRWRLHRPALGIAALPLPLAYVGALVFIIIGQLLGFHVASKFPSKFASWFTQGVVTCLHPSRQAREEKRFLLIKIPESNVLLHARIWGWDF